MTVTLSALRTEILTDPVGISYATFITNGDDNAIVDRLMSIARNVSVAPTSTITVGLATALTLQQQVVAAEYAVISQGQRDLWNCILTTATESIAISNTLIRGQVAFVWSAGTTTRANLQALQTRQCSRLETLFGENAAVSPSEVAKARTGQF